MKRKFLAAVFLLISTICFTNSCAKQIKIADDNLVFEYSSTTMFSSISVLIQKNKILLTEETRGLETEDQKEAAVSQKDWEELIALLRKIDLKKIPSFKAPTDNRAFDGDSYSYFKVIYQDKTYATRDFDGGHPPSEIKALIKKIQTLLKKFVTPSNDGSILPQIHTTDPSPQTP